VAASAAIWQGGAGNATADAICGNTVRVSTGVLTVDNTFTATVASRETRTFGSLICQDNLFFGNVAQGGYISPGGFAAFTSEVHANNDTTQLIGGGGPEPRLRLNGARMWDTMCRADGYYLVGTNVTGWFSIEPNIGYFRFGGPGEIEGRDPSAG